MNRSYTVGQKIGAAFAVVVGCGVIIAGVATYAVHSVVTAKDRLLALQVRNLVAAEEMHSATWEKSAELRAFLLTKDPSREEQVFNARHKFITARSIIGVADDRTRDLLAELDRAEADHQAVVERTIAGMASLATDQLGRSFEADIAKRRVTLDLRLNEFVAYERQLFDEAIRASATDASRAITAVIVIAVLAVLLAAAIAFALTRTLSRQIGSAVQHVQSSSADLQTAANQQASGAKEQATAMQQITTTMNELLATSRQIAAGAQRVVKIADEAAFAAHTGDQHVARSQQSIDGIRAQVEIVVTHMLELGRKSQQIGGILEIINELAEQTNILAINAGIEAAGAGDAGRRFGVVADEIRGLADRVGGSTKEIRILIEEIRSAVNGTVMATEGGAKTVEAGTRQFREVAGALGEIVRLVGTTAEAAREIELSTNQQASAAEQVNVAVGNVAQVSRETETSSTRTFQTASQLVSLSRELMKLIRVPTAA